MLDSFTTGESGKLAVFIFLKRKGKKTATEKVLVGLEKVSKE